MAQNNFKELEDLLSKDKEFTFQKVGNNLIGTRNVFGFIGDLLEHFIPRIVDVLVGFASGDNSNVSNNKYPHEGGKK